MRRLQILNIVPSNNPAVPATFEVGLNYLQLFHGQEWIDGLGVRSPFYTYDNVPGGPPPPPTGTGVLLATTFEVVENTNGKYNGRYTVYTKPSPAGLDPSSLTMGGDTIIRVNEQLPMDGAGLELTTGFITNISTYLLTITGESSLLLLEQQNVQTRPIEFMGNRASGWGEVFFQNMLRQTQCFASPSAPTNPFLGQLWYDTTNMLLMIREISGWNVVNSSFFGGPPVRVPIPSVAGVVSGAGPYTWTITHNLGLAAPFVCSVDFFVDTGGGVFKIILPSDVTFAANTITAVVTSGTVGYAIIRR